MHRPHLWVWSLERDPAAANPHKGQAVLCQDAELGHGSCDHHVKALRAWSSISTLCCEAHLPIALLTSRKGSSWPAASARAQTT